MVKICFIPPRPKYAEIFLWAVAKVHPLRFFTLSTDIGYTIIIHYETVTKKSIKSISNSWFLKKIAMYYENVQKKALTCGRLLLMRGTMYKWHTPEYISMFCSAYSTSRSATVNDARFHLVSFGLTDRHLVVQNYPRLFQNHIITLN